MRIIFFTVRLNLGSGGGSHRTLDLKLRYLVERGHHVKLVTLYSSGNQGLAEIPYELEELNCTGISFVKLQKLVADEIKAREQLADIFCMEGSAMIWAGGKYKAQGGGVPTIAYVNNYQASMGHYTHDYSSLPYFLRLYKKTGDLLYRLKRLPWDKFVGINYVNHYNKIYFVSPVTRDIYVQWGVNKELTAVLPDFVDTTEIPKQPSSTPFPSGFNILYAGRFSYDKGVDLLIHAMAQLSQPGVNLHLVGGGQQTLFLEKLIAQYNLASTIKVYSWKSPEELNDFYAQADVFIHPCRWPEPFGRTVLEAMSRGTTVITSSGTGSAWVVGDGGLIFKNGNVADLVDKILTLKNNPALRQQLIERAKKRAQELDYRNFTAQFEQELIALVK